MSQVNYLSAEQLSELGTHALHQLAMKSVGSLTTFRLVLGRCLLAIQRGEHFFEFGCSSAIHYATARLGLRGDYARASLRVARQLEALPKLTLAAEEGWLPWGKLREVVRVAEPETENEWLKICEKHTYEEVEQLVARRHRPDSNRSVSTELRLQLDPEARQLLERALQLVCQEVGRALPPAQALEYLCAEYLVRKGPVDVQARREEARTDLAAQADSLAELEYSARNIWEAATACDQIRCPGNPAVALVKPAKAHWKNPKLSFNPESRLATSAQRAELLRRDGYRCKTPGCTHHLFLEVHHIKFYADHGATVPDNLVCLCSKCHRNVHKGHLKIVGEAPHQLRFLDGRGRDLRRRSQLELAEWLDFYLGWEGTEHDCQHGRMMLSA